MIGPQSARITIVIPASVAERLKVQAEAQGRSMSNLAARLIALAFEQDRRDG
jgi:predicted HicB family RNase H-like nuclease